MANTSVRISRGSTRTRGTVTTTNATPANILFAAGDLVLPNNTAWLMTIDVIGRKSDGSQHGAYSIRALVKRGANAAATALVDSAGVTVVAEDDSTWDATIVANTTSGGAKVQVTGVAATTIKWIATVRRIVQVS